MRRSLSALVVLVLTGCASPAMVSAPPPAPLAVAPAGVSVSGQAGTDWTSRLRGSSTVVVRPLANVGVYASGLLVGRDSSDGAEWWVRHGYREAGVVGAFPVLDQLWLTGSVASGVGTAEGGGSIVGTCGEFGCGTRPYIVTADVERVSGRLGLHAVNGDDFSFGVGLRVARSSYHDVERDRLADELPTDDFTLWTGEPYVEARYTLGLATVDLSVTYGTLLGDSPQMQALNENGSRDLYIAEPVTVNLGATLDLWRLARGD